MTSKQAWEQFTTTGRIQDYMVYRSLLQMETLPGLLGELPAGQAVSEGRQELSVQRLEQAGIHLPQGKGHPDADERRGGDTPPPGLWRG